MMGMVTENTSKPQYEHFAINSAFPIRPALESKNGSPLKLSLHRQVATQGSLNLVPYSLAKQREV